MILKIKSYFDQNHKIIFLLLLTNISNLYAHNIVNGGCKLHCEHKVKSINNKSLDNKKEDFKKQNDLDSSLLKVNEVESSEKNDDDFYNAGLEEIAFLPINDFSHSEIQNNDDSDIEKIIQESNNQFEEIVPLDSNFDLEKKDLDFKIFTQEILPESVFMLVDKKVELEVKSIAELPEWSFLPENELKRNAILLFSNQRGAKRSCSKNQRVIKIPNTNVFQVSKYYLLSKGITRLILEDSIIALDV